MGKIKAIVKRADEPFGHVAYISNTLENLQKIVGGYIETVTLPHDVVIICDEEGMLKGKPHNCTILPNRTFMRQHFVGDIIAVGADGDQFADVPIDMDIWKRVYLGMEEKA